MNLIHTLRSLFASSGGSDRHAFLRNNFLQLHLLPGLGLTSVIAGCSLLLSYQAGISVLNPLLIAVVTGIIYRNLCGITTTYRPGIKFTMRRILRLAVILLGLRLSLTQLLEIGPISLIIVGTSTVSTFFLTCWLGHYLGVGRKLTQLIAAGTAICGASAIVATNAVVDSSEEDMTYAIATVTGFGTLAILTYPQIAHSFNFSPQTFGIWSGASVHEVAQVIATAFQNSAVSGELATVTKLARVILIIPIMLSLGWQRDSYDHTGTQPKNKPIFVPWFVVYFCILIAVNSTHIIPEDIKSSLITSNKFFLCMSLAAMGLETDLRNLTKLGLRPIYLSALSWLFISLISLLLIQILYP